MSKSAVGRHSIVSSGWVSKRDRHLQLVNASVFEARTKPSAVAKPLTKVSLARPTPTAQKHLRQEQSTIEIDSNDPKTSKPVTSKTGTPDEISVEGIKFRVINGGRELLRIRSELSLSREDLTDRCFRRQL